MPVLDIQSPQTAATRSIDFSSISGQRIWNASNFYETSVYRLSEIRFGETIYPLRRLLTGTFLRAKEEFLVEGLSPLFVGRGPSAGDAWQDFCLQFHARVQDLIYNRPFEMSAEEKSVWNKINEVADMTVFRNRTPLVVRQYGTISHGQLSYPCKIKWDNGHVERIDIRKVDSPEFVTFVPGQSVYAIVRRNPISREIIDIPFIERIHPLRSETEIAASGFLDRVKNAIGFPKADWD